MALQINLSSSLPPPIFRAEENIVEKKAIVIDFDILETKYGINPDEIGTAYFGTDTRLPPVLVGDLLKWPIDLKNSKFKGNPPPISFTFREAIQYVIHLIESAREGLRSFVEAGYRDDNARQGLIFVGAGLGDNIARELYLAITNIDTKRPDLIPKPPRYDAPTRSAGETDNNFWLGAILSILKDQGQIREYGKKDYFWVSERMKNL